MWVLQKLPKLLLKLCEYFRNFQSCYWNHVSTSETSKVVTKIMWVLQKLPKLLLKLCEYFRNIQSRYWNYVNTSETSKVVTEIMWVLQKLPKLLLKLCEYFRNIQSRYWNYVSTSETSKVVTEIMWVLQKLPKLLLKLCDSYNTPTIDLPLNSPTEEISYLTLGNFTVLAKCAHSIKNIRPLSSFEILIHSIGTYPEVTLSLSILYFTPSRRKETHLILCVSRYKSTNINDVRFVLNIWQQRYGLCEF
jgi:predicted site-specific integrase-resolvase